MLKEQKKLTTNPEKLSRTLSSGNLEAEKLFELTSKCFTGIDRFHNSRYD